MLRTSLFIAALAVAVSLQAQELPPGKGKAVLEEVCTECHGADVVLALHQSKAAWKDLVGDMALKGAQATPEQIATIVDYLATNFPAKVNINKGEAKEIAETLELTPAEAALIVKYRQDHGNFKDMDALYKVEGIERAKLESKKAQIGF